MSDVGKEYSLKVDHLSPQCDKSQLRKAFEPYGEVGDVYIPRDRDYGFVRFRSLQEAEEARDAMDGSEVLGRTMRVSLARDKEGEASRRRDGNDDGPPSKRSRGVPGPYTFKALCSDNVVASLMGKGGATLREIQELTKAHLEFSPRGVYFPATHLRTLTIRADDVEAVGRALDAFADRVREVAANLGDEDSKGKFPGDCRVVALVARFTAGSLIGKGGEDMRKLQAELQCYIEVEKGPIVEGHQRVEVKGEVEEVKRALRVVSNKVQAEVDRDWFPAWANDDPCSAATRQLPPSAPASRHVAEDPEAPSTKELAAFRAQYPMDDRAWEYFASSMGPIQAKVIQDFKPRPLRHTDEDYSALFTSFVASVAKRFADNPSGFRKGLGANGPDVGPSDEPCHGHRGVSEVRPPPPGPPPQEPRTPSEATSDMMATLNDVPRKYLGYDYALCCHLPVDRCAPLERCMRDVANLTFTDIKLRPPVDREETRRLTITGRLPDVYNAHLRLMWAFNEQDDEPEQEDPVPPNQLRQMQNQIAELQAQLQAVKSGGSQSEGGRRRGPDRGSKRRNGMR